MAETSQTSQTSVAVLVSGSGTLLQAILDNQGAYSVELVVADVECPALDRARAAGVRAEVVPLESDRDEWNRQLADMMGDPDIVVSAGFMKIVGEAFLDRFEGRLINTHPALLPAFPGAHAVRDALAYGVKVTGTTVHYIDAGVDTGEIIAQRAVDVRAGETEEDLHERIKEVERALIVDTLNRAETSTIGKVEFPA
ncbi:MULTISPECIES: phosphoribosylglycinamide formyltransferase [unclassified Corynebacterium]|uniref:phosphoribosylglycinamide formyltransferase n=1 Tax=unclassified Corynebacterium TaxID=2624378 RepID=UPI002654D589|nr:MULTISPECIES: phosphoribosylglycinamide formyltransferase [unclassified Corynebacterium]MDN8595259.1 phosphoribosylglycinamide formyltransferase [Corynebacterium sp. P4_F2]WKK56515.1 phosphoribosylglycinamide formyltransferase [Corynebacterium sp. P4-C1]WKK63950.1 phosphoribosylglycinamide formyltransferase [Corynebacterium sp. P8-C1]